ncbi:MAG: response regulator [Methylococcaceae bacterium]|nr:response regulator [Methylococcaceae bacterium]
MNPKPWHILLIDDNPEDRADLRQMLLQGSDRRYRFTEEELGAEGLRKIRAQQDPPYDCVLLDYHLCDMNAEEVLVDLCAASGLTLCPVVVVTGSYGMEGTQLIRAGAQDYIGKDWITPASLTRVIENAIERFALAVKRAGTEKALHESEARFRALLDTAPDAIVIVNAQGNIELVNALAISLFGYSREELLGQRVEMLMPTRFRHRHEIQREGYVQAPRIRDMDGGLQLLGTRKDGSEFPIEVSLSPLETTAGTWVSSAIRDITERKRIEAELNQALAAAEKANLAKSEFLSSMSHELRTPLNAILGFAQLLETGKPPPTASQALRLQEIIKAGWYLLKLINEILDLAFIESGKLSLSLESISLRDVLLECVSIIQPQAQQRSTELTLIPFNNDSLVIADHTRVKQVLLNLLSNAIKYNREHGKVEVAFTLSTPETFRISVKDNGAGLAPEKLAQLFQPFNRLGEEQGTEEGTGIGLMMSKRLIELMGGTIGVVSTEGIGSVFWIELPVAVAQPSNAEDTLPSKAFAAQTEAITGPHTLLYVEDNPANLLLVEQIIADQLHLTLLSARDGNRGIALARAHLPDVILMDINLPGISGLQALKILHEDPVTAHIPVIALSANAMPLDIAKGLKAGFFRYLTKPIKVNELLNALNAALLCRK